MWKFNKSRLVNIKKKLSTPFLYDIVKFYFCKSVNNQQHWIYLQHKFFDRKAKGGNKETIYKHRCVCTLCIHTTLKYISINNMHTLTRVIYNFFFLSLLYFYTTVNSVGHTKINKLKGLGKKNNYKYKQINKNSSLRK